MKKRFLIALLALGSALLLMMPMAAFAGSDITVTLDDAVYDETYKTNYGTVEYSTNYDSSNPNSATWSEINSGTTIDGFDYTISSGSSVFIRVSSVNSGGSFHLMTTSDQVLASDVAVLLNDSVHFDFRENGGGGGGDTPPLTHEITLFYGANGIIDMTNPLEVGDHSNQFIFITPDYGYEIDSVVIDKDTPSAHTRFVDVGLQRCKDSRRK